MKSYILFIIAICCLSNVAFSDDEQMYNPELAYNLTELATASYCNNDAIISWKCGYLCDRHPGIIDVQLMYNKSREALGYLAYNTQNNAILAVFRGTINIPNVMDDIQATKQRYLLCGFKCKVHKGFYSTFLNLRKQFWSALDKLMILHPNSDIIITGHSLGGALAQHAAAELAFSGINFQIITVGSPRVGDDRFAEWFLKIYKGNHFRITNDHDPVPHVPFKETGFKHIPTEVFYYENSRTKFIVCRDKFEDRRCSNRHVADLNLGDHVAYLGIPQFQRIKECRNSTDTYQQQ